MKNVWKEILTDPRPFTETQSPGADCAKRSCRKNNDFKPEARPSVRTQQKRVTEGSATAIRHQRRVVRNIYNCILSMQGLLERVAEGFVPWNGNKTTCRCSASWARQSRRLKYMPEGAQPLLRAHHARVRKAKRCYQTSTASRVASQIASDPPHAPVGIPGKSEWGWMTKSKTDFRECRCSESRRSAKISGVVQ